MQCLHDELLTQDLGDKALCLHLDSCPECRRVFAELNRGLAQATGGDSLPRWFEESGAELVRPGSKVDRYEILHPLGAGGMSVVFAARDTQLDRKVAIKFVRVMSGGQQRANKLRDLLMREARALAKLSHPNVVSVYDVSILDRWVYLVMEFVDGSTLQSWLAECTRSEDQLLHVFEQVADGLCEAHRVGVIHRDLKPSNILITKDQRALVCDFGLARIVQVHEDDVPDFGVRTPEAGDSTAGSITHEFVGTPAYMAPEVAAGESATEKSDQFSYWLCVVEAFSGRRSKVAIQDPAVEELEPALRPVVERGLCVDPGERFSGMDEARRQLRAAFAPRRWKAIAVVVSVCALVGFGLWAFTGDGSSGAGCEDLAERADASWRDREAGLRARLPAASLEELRRRYASWSQSWERQTQAACKLDVTHAPRQVRAATVECLSQELAMTVGVLDVLRRDATSLDRSQYMRAIRMIDTMTNIRCDSVDGNSASHYVVDPDRRADVESLRLALARERGFPSDDKAKLEALVQRAQALGYLPLIAETKYQATRNTGTDTAEHAIARYEAIADVAGRLNAQDLVAKAAITSARYAAGSRQVDVLEQLLDVAKRELDRAGKPAALEAEYYVVRTQLASHRGLAVQAIEFARKAKAVAQQYDRESQIYLDTLQELSLALARMGQVEAATQQAREAYETAERQFGVQDLTTADSAIVYASTLVLVGKYDRAVELAEQGAQVFRESLHEDAMQLSGVLLRVAGVHTKSGRYKEATAYAKQSLEVAVRLQDKDREHSALSSLVKIGLRRGPTEQTVAYAERARRLAASRVGKTNELYFHELRMLGLLYQGLGRPAEALAVLQELAALAETQSAQSPMLAVALGNSANAYLELRRPKDALAVSTRALAILRSFPSNAALNRYIGDIEIFRALALIDLGRSKPAASAIALVKAMTKGGGNTGLINFASHRLQYLRGRRRQARAAIIELGNEPKLRLLTRRKITSWLATPR